jgi:uncharacterized glyoxalase superfamily protein PhnB
MTDQIKPIPEGYNSVTPGLVIRNGARAIEFYKRAFGAAEKYRMDAPDGSLLHAEIKIGNSTIMLNSEDTYHPGHDENCARTPSELKGTTGTFYLYVEDSDAVFRRAVAAGAKALYPVTDMFWGDRMGNVRDPFGYIWNIATRTKLVAPEQLRERAKEFYAKTAVH